MQFIHFDDVGRRALDLSCRFPEDLDPLVDSHMTKPQEAANGPKPQTLQVQIQRHTALSRSRRVRFMGHGEKVSTCFALVALLAFLDSTFDFVRTGTSRAVQHRRLHVKG